MVAPIEKDNMHYSCTSVVNITHLDPQVLLGILHRLLYDLIHFFKILYLRGEHRYIPVFMQVHGDFYTISPRINYNVYKY